MMEQKQKNQNHLTLDHVIIKRKAISDTDDGSAIHNQEYVEINDGTYIEGPVGVGANNVEGAQFVINGGTIKGTVYREIQVNNNQYGTGIIKGGIIEGKSNAILFSGSKLEIEQTDKPIYISSKSEIWEPAILMSSTSSSNITGNNANNCTNDVSQTTSGLCIYGGQNNGAIQNSSSGDMKINGGTYVGGYQSINNNNSGNLYIENATISSDVTGILNRHNGNIYICRSTITGITDLNNQITDGHIYYAPNVIFLSGNNTPKTGGQTANIQLSEEAC